MVVRTERFGDISIDEAAIIHFPEGILGFEHVKRYVLVSRNASETIRFLQAVDEPSLAFAVMDPYLFRPDYAPQLWDEDRRALEWDGQSTLTILTILTVPEDVENVTANLMAPVIINVEKRLGRQVVQGYSEYSTRHRILDEIARARRLVLARRSDPSTAKAAVAAAEVGVVLENSV